MKLPSTMQIGGIDPVDVYLVALNSHDGTSAFRLLVSPVRVVCANTQALAVRRAQASFSIRHTSGARGNIAQARQALGLTFRYVEAFQAEAEKLIAREMTDTQFKTVIGALWTADPESKRAATIAGNRESALWDLYRAAPTNRHIRGTRWAGYQAVTEYLDHFAPIADKVNPAAARAERVAVGGHTAPLKARAFDLIAAL